MNITKACEILKGIATDHGEDMLVTLMYMREHMNHFEPHEVQAYQEFMRVGSDFFADTEESV
jgi:hypothetical protein